MRLYARDVVDAPTEARERFLEQGAATSVR